MDADKIQIVASKHGVSPDAVQHLYHAILVGKGTMAQFSHPEFGGTGQWMRGGMIMIGDMFNNALKARVEALCNDVAQLLLSDSVRDEFGCLSIIHHGCRWLVAGGTGSACRSRRSERTLLCVFPR